MNREDRALVKETKALISEVEAGNPDRAAWIAIQDRVKRLYEGRNQTEVGNLIGRSHRWVSDVLSWDWQDAAKPRPWAGPRGEKREVSTARKVLSNPETRRQVIDELPDEHRDEVRQAIWDKDEAEVLANPDYERAHREHKNQSFEDAARRCIHKAFNALGDRAYYYGDVPLTEMEQHTLEQIEKIVASLLRGVAMDDELKELLNDATQR